MVDLEDLRWDKNLLAFSGGVDSSALFFMLLDEGIAFDIAIVDYQMRKQSKLEVQYAKDLAKQYQKQCFVYRVKLEESNFENNARKVRYEFFESLIKTYQYKNLILAHQLNDRLEWFLMQFFKGGGLNSLLGFDRVEQREGYNIVRPLWENSREEILCFLKDRHFFEDSDNYNSKYLRNQVRMQYANQMLLENKKGILRSFAYLKEEKNKLYSVERIQKIGHIFYFEKQEELQHIFLIDRILKQLGYVLSHKQRLEMQRQGFSICFQKDLVVDCNARFIFVAKCRFQDLTMPKNFKNLCRDFCLPKRLRKEFFGLFEEKRLGLEGLEIFRL